MVERWDLALQDNEGVRRLAGLITPNKTKIELREMRIARKEEIKRYKSRIVQGSSNRDVA